MWEEVANAASGESTLWAAALRPRGSWEDSPVFSALAPEAHAVALETIYEGYLVHYASSRVFDPADGDTALLLGDFLYAHGLVRVAEAGDVAAVADFAELISLCAQVRADGREGEAAAWAATGALLGGGTVELAAARDRLRLDHDAAELERIAREAAGDEAVDDALAAHARLVG